MSKIRSGKGIQHGFAIPSSLVHTRSIPRKCSALGVYSGFSCADFLSLCSLQNLAPWKGARGQAEPFIKVGWWDQRRCKSALGSARNCWAGSRSPQPTVSPGFGDGVAKWAGTQGLPWLPAAGPAAGPAWSDSPSLLPGKKGAFRCPQIQQIRQKAQTGSQGI